MRFGNVLKRGPSRRALGGVIGIAGLAFVGLGTAGVGTITSGIVRTSAPASCPTDPSNPVSTDACVNESFEGLTAAQDQANGVTNDCGKFNLSQNSTTDGWVFVLPQGDSDGDKDKGGGNTFKTGTVYAVFQLPSSITVTLKATVTGPPAGQKAVVSAPAGSILLEAYGTVIDDSGTSDGNNTLFFQVTGVCVASGTTTTTTSSTGSKSSSGTTTSSSSTGSKSSSGTTTSSSSTRSKSSSGTTTSSSGTGGGSGSVSGTTTSSGASTNSTAAAGGVQGITTANTGADVQFGAGLALLVIGGGVTFGGSRLGRRKRQ